MSGIMSAGAAAATGSGVSAAVTGTGAGAGVKGTAAAAVAAEETGRACVEGAWLAIEEAAKETCCLVAGADKSGNSNPAENTGTLEDDEATDGSALAAGAAGAVIAV